MSPTTTTTTQQPQQFTHHPCARCTQPSTRHCPRCHQAFYCSRQCQGKHHKLHKRNCASLAQARATRDEEQARRQRIDEEARRDAARRARVDAEMGGSGGGGGGGSVREFETVEETRRWVREVNELDGEELEDEHREEREGKEKRAGGGK